MYDAFDCKSTVKVKIPEGFSKAYLCDLLEREQSELAITDGTVTLPVSNFEIVTLKLTK
jgi:alpha-mannosidase